MSIEITKCSKCGSNVLLIGDGVKSYNQISTYIEVPKDIIYKVHTGQEALKQPIVPKDKKLIYISNGSVEEIKELEIATPEEVLEMLEAIPKQEEPLNKQDIDDLLDIKSSEIPETQALNETLNIEKNIIDSNKK